VWLWSFYRDTQHLSTTEIGAYFLILGAMWSRPSCDIPDDPHKVRLICKVSTRVFNGSISKNVLPFFHRENGVIISRRLQKEASYVEKSCSNQSERKRHKSEAKSLKNNKPPSTVDISATGGPVHPTQQPNNPTLKKEGSSNLCKTGKNNSDDFSFFGDPDENLPDDVEVAFEEFNGMAERAGIPRAQVITGKRRSGIKARLKDAGGLDGWRACLAKVEASAYCTGKVNGWKATLDYLISESNFAKVMEGNYDDRTSNQNGGGRGNNSQRRDPHFQQMAGFAAVADRGSTNG